MLIRMASLLPPAPEPPATDSDNVLMYMLSVLKTTHQAFYSHIDRGVVADVKTIMPSLKREVLSGCTIVLSGVIPTDLDPHQNELWLRV